jgi:hypothetical protein
MAGQDIAQLLAALVALAATSREDMAVEVEAELRVRALIMVV